MIPASSEANMRYHQLRVISGKGTAPYQFAETLRGLAIDTADRLYAVGDAELKVFSSQGELVKRWRTERPGYSVAVADDGTVYVGQAGQVQLFDREGRLQETWRDADRLGLVTAIGIAGKNVLLADAKGRCIRRYDQGGRFLNDIGSHNRMRGFLIPNQHLDFAIDARGTILAANPGKHRVERYTVDDKLLGHFGRFDGRDPAGFGGCCNPTNIALTREGLIVVTEKAGPRAKVYDADGKLLTLMGEDDFDPTCKNMDVAVDSNGRIYVVDTARLHICVFAPKPPEVTTQPTTATTRPLVKP